MEIQDHTYSSQHNVDIIFRLLELVLNIKTLMYKARPLCEHECNKLKQYLQQLLTHIIQSFPNQALTTKLHIAIVHIPEFIDRYHTIGMFGEHAIESEHHIFNQLNENYCHSPCEQHERLAQMLNKQHQWVHGSRLSK